MGVKVDILLNYFISFPQEDITSPVINVLISCVYLQIRLF